MYLVLHMGIIGSLATAKRRRGGGVDRKAWGISDVLFFLINMYTGPFEHANNYSESKVSSQKLPAAPPPPSNDYELSTGYDFEMSGLYDVVGPPTVPESNLDFSQELLQKPLPRATGNATAVSRECSSGSDIRMEYRHQVSRCSDYEVPQKTNETNQSEEQNQLLVSNVYEMPQDAKEKAERRAAEVAASSNGGSNSQLLLSNDYEVPQETKKANGGACGDNHSRAASNGNAWKRDIIANRAEFNVSNTYDIPLEALKRAAVAMGGDPERKPPCVAEWCGDVDEDEYTIMSPVALDN